jgi:hypothetical protein
MWKRSVFGEPLFPSGEQDMAAFRAWDDGNDQLWDEYQPKREVMKQIWRLIMPRPEVLPAIAEAFGTECGMYETMEALVSATDDPEYPPIHQAEMVVEFFALYGELFEASITPRPTEE